MASCQPVVKVWSSALKFYLPWQPEGLINIIIEPEFGPVRTMQVFLFCKKPVNSELINSSVNGFFHLPKFSQVPHVLRPTVFCQVMKFFLP